MNQQKTLIAKRAAMFVVPKDFVPSPDVQRNIQSVIENASTAPYVYLQVIAGTYYQDSKELIDQYGLELNIVANEDNVKKAWDFFFLRVGPMDTWLSSTLLRLMLWINPSQNRFFIIQELRDRCFDELSRRISAAPETFGHEFLTELWNLERSNHNPWGSKLTRILDYWTRRHQSNRIREVDESPISPDETLKDPLTLEEKKFVSIFGTWRFVQYIPSMPSILYGTEHWLPTLGGEYWMECCHLHGTFFTNFTFQGHPNWINHEGITWDGERPIVSPEALSDNFCRKARIESVAAMKVFDDILQLYVVTYPDTRAFCKSFVIGVFKNAFLNPGSEYVGPNWKEWNLKTLDTRQEVEEWYSTPVAQRGWSFAQMDRLVEWSKWKTTISDFEEWLAKDAEDKNQKKRAELMAQVQKREKQCLRLRHEKSRYGLCDVIRVLVSAKQRRETVYCLSKLDFPFELKRELMNWFHKLGYSTVAEDRVSEASESNGHGKHKNLKESIEGMKRLIEDVKPYEAIAFKRTQMDAFCKLTGDEAGGIHIYLAIRQKDVGLTAWVSPNNPRAPSTVGMMTRIVGYYQESTMKSSFANGMDWTEWTVFRLEAGTVDISDRRSLMWFVVLGGPKIIYYPFCSVKRYTLPDPSHNEFGSLEVTKDNLVVWKGYQSPPLVPHDEPITFRMSDFAGGSSKKLEQRAKKRKGGSTTRRKRQKREKEEDD